MARGNYGERMRETEHLTDQANWRRNMQNALTPPFNDERIKELVIDALAFDYEMGEFENHHKVLEVRLTLNR